MNIRTYLTLLLFLPFSALLTQAQQQKVKLKITQHEGDRQVLLDTSFVMAGGFDVDSLLEELGYEEEGENLSKVIVITDLDKQADKARSHPSQTGPRPMLGIYMETNRNDHRGVRISSTVEGGAADMAGIRPNDLLTRLGQTDIEDHEDVSQAKKGYAVGDTMYVAFERNGEKRNVYLTLLAEQTGGHVKLKKAKQGYMGVYTEEVNADLARQLNLPNQLGVYIEGIVPKSGADKSGMEKGDVILRINGRELDAAWELSDALDYFSPGDSIQVSYWRENMPRDTWVLLTERIEHRPAPTRRKQVRIERAYLGVYLDDGDDEKGVPITSVRKGEAAEAAGLQKGDRILVLGDISTPTYGDLSDAMGSFNPGQTIRVKYRRDGKKKKTEATLGSRTVHHWVTLPEEMEMPAEELVQDIEDPEQAREIQTLIENPTLDMEKFEFFPNPNEGRFRLRFEMATAGDTDVRVFSSSGQEVYRERLRNFEGTFDQFIDLRKKVSDGIYFLQVTQNGSGMVEQFIVQQ